MFKIYFQSGDFYSDQGISWVTLFKDFLIPLAGVGVPLLLFYWGIKQERDKVDRQRAEDKAKSESMEKMRLLYFHSIFKEVFKHCLHFHEVLIGLLAAGKDNKYYSGNLELDGDADLKRIVSDLDRENLFYAYQQNIDDLSLNVIFRALDAAYGLQQTFRDVWSRATTNVTDRENELRSTTADFGLRLIHVEDVSPDDKELKARLIQIFTDHAQKDFPPDRVYQGLIESLTDPFVSTIENSGKTTNLVWEELYKRAVHAQIIDKQVDSIMQQYNGALNSLSEKLNRVVSDLYNHYLPLEDYLVENNLLTDRLLDDDEIPEDKSQA